MAAGPLVIMAVIMGAMAEVTQYTSEDLGVGSYIIARKRMWSEPDSPREIGYPYIRVDVQADRRLSPFHGGPNDGSFAQDDTSGKIMVAVIYGSMLEVGIVIEGADATPHHYYCCTKDMIDRKDDEKLCYEHVEHSLILRNPEVNIQRHWIEFSPSSDSTKAHHVFQVNNTGPHILLVTNCDTRLLPYQINITGVVTWMNPYGLLPAEQLAYMPFYEIMIMLYGILVAGWCAVIIRRCRFLHSLHHLISTAIFSGLLETVLYYVYYRQYNNDGNSAHGSLFAAVVFLSIRRTFLVISNMFISIDPDTPRPELPQWKRTIFRVGILYFFLVLPMEMITVLSDVYGIKINAWAITLAVLTGILNVYCCWFIFASIYRLRSSDAVKSVTYKCYGRILLFCLLATIAVVAYAITLTETHSEGDHWSTWWLFDNGVWTGLSYVILCTVAILFCPRAVSRDPFSAQLQYEEIKLDLKASDVEEDEDI